MSDNEHVVNNSTDSFFQISSQEDGIYLTVLPVPEDGVPPNETVVNTELTNQGITEWDEVAVKVALHEASGKAVKIAQLPEPEIRVFISKDKMEASLQIEMKSLKQSVSQELVMAEIAEKGIVFGIDADLVKKAIGQPGLDMVFARGRQPVHGSNAEIKDYVKTEKQGRPLEMENGRVDFKNLKLFTVVQKGDLLAEKIPATSGEPGSNVLGHPIPAKPGKDMPLPQGKNTEFVEPNQVVASIAGQVVIENKKISVIPIIEIKGDVDLSTGNIEFLGNVTVKGSVQQGFSVKAEGNVEIAGTVSGGIVEGKNVVIKTGIQGMHRGYIKAKENVVAQFIENAIVHAGNEVLVSEVILHSKVSAGKKIIVEGRRGMITGGFITAGEEIRAQTIGNQMAVPTELEVGVNPALREEHQQLKQELKKVEDNLDQTQKALTILKAMDQTRMTNDKREMMLKLTKAQFHLVGQLGTMRKRMEQIQNDFEEMRFGRVKVANMLHPGVKVVVGTLVKPIREPLSFTTLYAEDGEIKIGTFK